MPSLKDIRKRIGSVKNTQKITRAMKLVAAARLRKAQDSIIAARPYSRALEHVVADLAEQAGSESHPLLAGREGTRTELVILTSDRGLAGSFNAQLLRRVEGLLREMDHADLSLRIVGRKGNDYIRRHYPELILARSGAPSSTDVDNVARELASHVVDDFVGNRTDRVLLVYNEFKSAISQKVVVQQLLPVQPEVEERGAETEQSGEFIFEPSLESLLEHLVPLYVQNGIYRACLESIASELGARMSAMDSATRNAGEMIDRLTLQYNRARQAAITKELLEIIAGAESL